VVHTVILVLVDPALARVGADEELVVAEANVDERIDKGPRQVLPRGIEVGRGASAGVFEVSLVDVLERLGLDEVERLAEGFKVLGELGVVEDLDEGLVLVLQVEVDLLPRENVGELTFEGAMREDERCLVDGPLSTRTGSLPPESLRA
jgi:hypothetical protein